MLRSYAIFIDKNILRFTQKRKCHWAQIEVQ